MWRTVRIRQKEYEFVKELARREGKSMCEVVSKIIAEVMKGDSERKQHDFSFKEFRIGPLRLFRRVKIKATALGLVKLSLSFLITELEEIIKDASLSAEEKVEKIKAKLSEWDVRREEREKEVEVYEW